MDLHPGHIAVKAPSLDAQPELRLLTELPPWHLVFVENLLDTIFRRRPPHYWPRYPNADFWSDVFVPRGISWTPMRQSVLAHALLILAIYGLSTAWFLDRQQHPA